MKGKDDGDYRYDDDVQPMTLGLVLVMGICALIDWAKDQLGWLKYFKYVALALVVAVAFEMVLLILGEQFTMMAVWYSVILWGLAHIMEHFEGRVWVCGDCIHDSGGYCTHSCSTAS